MTYLGPGATFADQIVTIARLHELVDDATLHDLVPSSCATGVRLFSSTLPTILTLGQPYLETDGRLWFHNGTTFQRDNHDEPYTVNLLNSAGQNVSLGDCVSLRREAPGGFDLTANNRIGFMQANCAMGATGTVILSGLATVRLAPISVSQLDGALVVGPAGGGAGTTVARTITVTQDNAMAQVLGMCFEETQNPIALYQIRVFH